MLPQDSQLRPPMRYAGVGLFPTGALINHSCSPNAMQSFQGQQVTFTALQNIAPGAEITISYIELAATYAERRQQLLELYYFDIDNAHQVSCTLLNCGEFTKLHHDRHGWVQNIEQVGFTACQVKCCKPQFGKQTMLPPQLSICCLIYCAFKPAFLPASPACLT